jgi:4-hydroxybenzoate polyprenyltransferase
MQKFFTFEFWTASSPMMWQAALAFLIFFVALLAAGIYANYYAKTNKKKLDRFDRALFDRSAEAAIVMGAMGILMAFCFVEGVYLLSARVWVLIWIAGALAWSSSICKYFRAIKEERAQQKKKAAYRKYLK